MLDYFMWALTYFISFVALENIAWPATVCTNIRAELDQNDEAGVMSALIVILASMLLIMFGIVYSIGRSNEKELLDLRKEGVVTKVAKKVVTNKATVDDDAGVSSTAAPEIIYI